MPWKSLSKLNTGAFSKVEKSKGYSLYYMDEKSDWHLLETRNCPQDSLIIFNKVPGNTLYRLLETGEKNRLERPFTYENKTQIFW